MSRATRFFLVCLAISFWWLLPFKQHHLAQTAADGSLHLDGYRVQPLQDFQIDALVLSREDYRLGREAQISPTDLALGWGPLGDAAIAAKIHFSQGGRWYHWQTEQPPLPPREIETHSANMHMIPASDTVAHSLAAVSAGEHIHLSGKLVQVSAADGWRWTSSLSREDTGAGACELVWVERLDIDSQ
ncbi:hypothetical protein ACOXVJ_02900 [Pseudomonas knackmussii]|uniref:hypothetical protein n=1 Tax=Pseudomonas knackmussii TaxID=65741 RepID=UPI003BDB6AE1